MAHQPSRPWSRDRILLHTKRLSYNALLQIASQFLPLLAGALSIPLVYKNLGADDFGIFTIGLSALGLFSLLDLGLGRATVRFVSRAFAARDFAGAASVAAHSALILGLFSTTLSAVIFVVIPIASVHWFHTATQSQQRLETCLYILVLALPFAGVTSVFRAILESKERFFAISVIQVLLGILTYAVPLGLSFITHDIRLMISGAVACRVMAFGAFLIAASAAWQGPFPWSRIDLKGQREFRSFSLWMVVSNIVGSSIVYGDRALLVRLFGLGEIAFYNVPLEFLGRFMIIVNSAATVAFPALSRAAEDKHLFEDVYVAISTVLGVLVALTLLGVSVLTPIGLHVWLGDVFRAHSTGLVRILLVGVAFQTYNVFALAALNARGFARPITLMHLLETPAYFWALYHYGSRFGLSGVALVWSGRLIFEYVCFAFFQAHIGTATGAPRRIICALIGAINAAPLALMANYGNPGVAFSAAGIATVGSLLWVTSLFRRA